MADNQETGFRIGLDAPEVEDEIKPEPPPPKPKGRGSNSRVLLVFLGFLIIGGVLVWFYYDIHDRLQSINASGSEEVAQLSRDVNDKIAQVNNQLSVMTESVESRLAAIKSDVGHTKSRIDQLQASIASFEKNLGNLKQDITPLKQQVQTMGGNIGEIRETTQAFKKNQTNMQNKLASHAGEIQRLDEKMVDQQRLDNALKKEREFNKQNMAHAAETLFSEIASFQDRLKALSKNMEELEHEIKDVRRSLKGPSPQAPPEAPPQAQEPLSPGKMPIPENGEIIEQEIE